MGDTVVVDRETGEVIEEGPSDIAVDRQRKVPKEPPELPPLRTGEEVLAEIQHCFYRQEVIARRIGVARKEFSGYRDDDGTLHEGVEMEYEEAAEKVERELWAEYKSGEVERWPGESTRRAIAHDRMKEELKKRYRAVRGEIKNLESYQKILDSQMEGLRSLLSWFKEEAKFYSSGAPPADWSQPPPDRIPV